MKDNCIHPTTKTPYILSLKCGKDNSPEGLQVRHVFCRKQHQLADKLQHGLTHGFVVEFASPEDRDYYVTKDPTHQEFVKSLPNVLEKITVLDFSDGVY